MPNNTNCIWALWIYGLMISSVLPLWQIRIAVLLTSLLFPGASLNPHLGCFNNPRGDRLQLPMAISGWTLSAIIFLLCKKCQLALLSLHGPLVVWCSKVINGWASESNGMQLLFPTPIALVVGNFKRVDNVLSLHPVLLEPSLKMRVVTAHFDS